MKQALIQGGKVYAVRRGTYGKLYKVRIDGRHPILNYNERRELFSTHTVIGELPHSNASFYGTVCDDSPTRCSQPVAFVSRYVVDEWDAFNTAKAADEERRRALYEENERLCEVRDQLVINAKNEIIALGADPDDPHFIQWPTGGYVHHGEQRVSRMVRIDVGLLGALLNPALRNAV